MREQINPMWPDELRAYLQDHNEDDYLLVDVRQPKEYTRKHIPGAGLMPLKKFTAAKPDLPKDKDLIFYCAKGVRSRVAADFCLTNGYDQQRLFNLMGGIAAWQGVVLDDFPKVKFFEDLPELRDVIPVAMNLEKGAFLFYSAMLERYNHDYPPGSADNMAAELKKMAEMETAHAKLLYDIVNHDSDFKNYFDTLGGDIIEGGMLLKEALQKLDDLPGDSIINALEMALEIEYSAYDLYRSLADTYSGDKAAAFLDLSQAERGHIQLVAELFESVTADQN